MLQIKSVEELNEFLSGCTYYIDEDAELMFDLKTDCDIEALDINGAQIEARDISCVRIECNTIKARDIDAEMEILADGEIRGNDISCYSMKCKSVIANNIEAQVEIIADDVRGAKIKTYSAKCENLFADNAEICDLNAKMFDINETLKCDKVSAKSGGALNIKCDGLVDVVQLNISTLNFDDNGEPDSHDRCTVKCDTLRCLDIACATLEARLVIIDGFLQCDKTVNAHDIEAIDISANAINAETIAAVDAKCDLLNAKKGAFQTIEAREVCGLVVAESADIVDGNVRETKLSTSVALETILYDLKSALTSIV